jgi:hypothetical protein
MRRSRQIAAETELMQSLPRVRESRTGLEDCPHRNLLKQFLRGKIVDEGVQNRILRHLDSCGACITTLKELRNSRTRVTRILLTAAAILLIGVLVRVWPGQNTERDMATIELHASGVLRGVEEPTLTLPRSTKRLHIIFSGEEPPGLYELRLLKSEADAFPLIEVQGPARSNRHNLELNVDFNVSRLPAGTYILAFRHPTLSWQYRPLRIK